MSAKTADAVVLFEHCEPIATLAWIPATSTLDSIRARPYRWDLMDTGAKDSLGVRLSRSSVSPAKPSRHTGASRRFHAPSVRKISPRVIRPGSPPLDEYYNSLFTAFGPQHWWPAKMQFEIIVGAILTQNTSWTNVERAISNLRTAGLLSPKAIESVPPLRLQGLIRPSGYFRQKARKLKAFCQFLRSEYGGSLKRMFDTPTLILREKLLDVFGIGPETADSILLYAGDHPVFVGDTYAKRILLRHGWIDEEAKYDDVRWVFERHSPGHSEWFNEFHALIVTTGKNFCRKQEPLCDQCPLGRYREEGR